MRIDYIEVCGFRGFREKVRIELGRGFTVISGRNGSGKSTVCDAVEFAITGTINKYTVEKTAKESLSDYLWWRGDGRPEAYYVTVAFIADDGQPFVVTRSRELGSNKRPEEIQAVLCRKAAPNEALKQLMRTTIIRDEWIASLSLDLRETERFDFVRGALGAPEGASLAVRAKEVVKVAEEACRECEQTYDKSHTLLSDHIAKQAASRATLSHSGDTALALKTVAKFVPSISSDVVHALEAGRQVLVSARVKFNQKGEALQLVRDFVKASEEFFLPNAVAARQSIAAELEKAMNATVKAKQGVLEAEQEVVSQEHTNETAASLQLLVEHGERLGLFNGQCPLCSITQTLDHFHLGLEAARNRMEMLSTEVLDARSRLETTKKKFQQYAEHMQKAQVQMEGFEKQEAALREREQELVNIFEELGVQQELMREPEALGSQITRERDDIIDLERALLMLESSQLVSKLATVESDIEELRGVVVKKAEALSRARKALSLAKQLDRSVRRVSAEIIDERLAEISPLLNELYERLRPHNDWRTIEYKIRGDVRRFLSLKVGAGLNPQFVFSSGQRRAAGIAFLLSVHLAKSWTHLRTLILDDPVQHIDDFRALQLVEVLAAIRREGRQVVCAVEDTALADLLCRRLPSTDLEDGRRLNIGLGAHGTVRVMESVKVVPMPIEVLHRVGADVTG